MKKLFRSMLVLCMMFISTLMFVTVNAFEPVPNTVVGESSYYQGETVETNYLEGKLEHNKWELITLNLLCSFSLKKK